MGGALQNKAYQPNAMCESCLDPEGAARYKRTSLRLTGKFEYFLIFLMGLINTY